MWHWGTFPPSKFTLKKKKKAYIFLFFFGWPTFQHLWTGNQMCHERCSRNIKSVFLAKALTVSLTPIGCNGKHYPPGGYPGLGIYLPGLKKGIFSCSWAYTHPLIKQLVGAN